MNCSKCKKFPIQNKKYELCKFCMHEKTHGETFQETQAKQQQKWMNNLRSKIKRDNDVEEEVRKVYSIKKSTKPIKRQTSKEGRVKSALSDLKTSIELEAVQNDSYFCCGCGKSYPGLDKSHILSVGMHKHLELVKENIQLLCRTCHMIWEGGTINERLNLLCFEDNIVFIYFYHEETYRKTITELEEYVRWMDEEQDYDRIQEVKQVIVDIQKKVIVAGGSE